LFSFLGCPLAAQPPEVHPDQVRTAPIEVFADFAFQWFDIAKPARNEQLKLLLEIYDRTGEARHPLPFRQALPRETAGPSNAATAAAALEVDALNLRCRVVRRLLDVDPAIARSRFYGILTPQWPKAACADRRSPTARYYFATMAAVVRPSLYSKDDLRRQEPLKIVQRRLGAVSTIAEITAAASVVPSLLDQDIDAVALSASFAAAVASVQDSDRGFAAELYFGRLMPALLEAAGALEQHGASPVPLLTAVRAMLVRHLSGARCQDSPGPGEEDPIDLFHKRIAGTDIQPLAIIEMQPSKRVEGAAADSWKYEAAYAALQADITALGKVDKGQNLATLRMTSEWEVRARDLIRRVESWRGPDRQSRMEFFHQAVSLWFQLMDMLPKGALHSRALSGLVRVMADPEPQREEPAEWLWELANRVTLMHRIFSGPQKEATRELLQQIPGFPYETGREIPEALRDSPSPTLAAYGALELLRAGAQPR
jgi:hypothetical protein